MAQAADASENQIEKVRQIVNVASFSEVETRVRALNDSAWDETVEDITKWELVEDEYTIIKGDGVDIDDSRARLGIRNRVRVRLGYLEVNSNGRTTDDFGIVLFPSRSMKKNIVW